MSHFRSSYLLLYFKGCHRKSHFTTWTIGSFFDSEGHGNSQAI